MVLELTACRAKRIADRDVDQPELYFITDHYRGHASVLVRLADLTVAEARLRLERGWRAKAPNALIKQLDAGPVREPARKVKRR